MALRKKSKGATLIELIIYCVLSVAALGILVALVTVARRTGDHTYAQYLVAGNMATTIRMIRKELQSTSLASVTVYDGTGGQRPGFSCISAYDGNGEFKLGAYGAPHWQKHVYYTLNGKQNISRSFTPISDTNYLPTLAPDPAGDPGGKPLMNDALPANKAVGQWHPASPSGGLEVGFVRRNGNTETISKDNPRLSNNPAHNTRLIEVALRTLDESGPHFMEVKFRVSPRY